MIKEIPLTISLIQSREKDLLFFINWLISSTKSQYINFGENSGEIAAIYYIDESSAAKKLDGVSDKTFRSFNKTVEPRNYVVGGEVIALLDINKYNDTLSIVCGDTDVWASRNSLLRVWLYFYFKNLTKNHNQHVFQASVSFMADELNMTRQNLSRIINKLIDLKLLYRTGTYSVGFSYGYKVL